MSSVHVYKDEGTVQTIDAHSIFKQTQEIQTNMFELKNDGCSILRLQWNFVDGIQ